MSEIKRRERDAVLQSLQAGLVPRMGAHLIQVGRKQEVAAMLSDLERIEQGGAAFRLLFLLFPASRVRIAGNSAREPILRLCINRAQRGVH